MIEYVDRLQDSVTYNPNHAYIYPYYQFESNLKAFQLYNRTKSTYLYNIISDTDISKLNEIVYRSTLFSKTFVYENNIFINCFTDRQYDSYKFLINLSYWNNPSYWNLGGVYIEYKFGIDRLISNDAWMNTIMELSRVNSPNFVVFNRG